MIRRLFLRFRPRPSRPIEPPPTPLPARVYRYARVGVHVGQGLLTTMLVFPWVGAPQRAILIRRWSRRLLNIICVDTRVGGVPIDSVPGNTLLVANHVSWLDIVALNAVRPARFVAKAELRRWPVVGRLIAQSGTLFIEREKKRDAARTNQGISRVLAEGDTVAIFPEGTTTDGRDVLKFHGSLLQPAIDAGGHVQPVAIRYLDAHGRTTDAAAYIDDMTFMASFWRVLGQRRMAVELILPEALATHGVNRRELAQSARDKIVSILAARGSGTAPGTPAGHPDAAQ